MAYADNPFAPISDKERRVLHHLKTVLNRVSPENAQAIMSDLIDVQVPPLSQWDSEMETSHIEADTVFLLGLSKYPPVITDSDLEPKEGGGPIDLYTETENVGIAIEGKTKGALRRGQLSRYATALGADSFSTVSWSDLYRTFSAHRSELEEYPGGLVGEFLDYLALADLHRPHQLAEYQWGEGDLTKQIRVEESQGLQVVWKVEEAEGGGKQDERVQPWRSFCDLFDDIERRNGAELIRSIFVEGEQFDKLPELDSDQVLGQTQPVRDYDASNRLRLNFYDDEGVIKLKTVRQPEGDSVGSPSHWREHYTWYVQPKELKSMLAPKPDLPGFEHEFREALFIDRDETRVREELW